MISYKYTLSRNRFCKEFIQLNFFFIGEISHNNFNAVQLLDEDLNKFLKEFHTKGYLDDTLLILLGDHGWRYGDFRQTVQGKLEERLPLFSMTFPKWFKQKYPTLANNLRTNTQRLTSWFDVYATFNHLLTYPKEPQRFDHGTSLLNEVPLERSCTDASIPEHWCPCVQWSDVDHKHEHLKYAALTAINHINNLNFQEPLAVEKCSKLSLLEMKNAMIETPTRKVLRFRRSGKDGYVPQFSHDIRPKDHCNYQITFVTFPNHGVFEASVHFESGRFFVKGSISRINKYGDQPKCIADTFPHLRKYCYCK